jgi:hypothetical protein
MNRREAISRVAILVGSTVIGAELFISGCKNESTSAIKFSLDEGQMSFLNEVGEVILPKTAKSDGAKAANVGKFMQAMVRDCYTPEEQKIFLEGIDALNKTADKSYGKQFTQCSDSQKHDLLVKLDMELKEYNKKSDLLKQEEVIKEKASQASGKPNYLKKTLPLPYFAMIKQLTLLGFFTSEIGYKSMGYVSVPGRYDGDVKEVQRTGA